MPVDDPRHDELDAAILGLGRQRMSGRPTPRSRDAADAPPARRGPLVPISAEIARVGEHTVEAYARLRAEVEEAVSTGRMIVEVDPALIDDSAWRDRADGAFEDEAFLKLCQSIRDHGQVNPIGLRRAAEGGSAERYEIVFGHRRARAARVAGRKVRAVILSADDRTLVSRMLVENAIRTDLSPWEKAQHYRRLLADGVFSRAELADLLGVSPQEVSNVAALADLPAAVVALLGDPRQLGINAGQRLLAAVRHLDQMPPALVRRIQALPEDPRLRAAKLTAWLGETASDGEEPSGFVIRDRQGRRYGRVSRSGRQLLIRFQPGLDETIIQRLAARIPELYEELAGPVGQPGLPPARGGT